MTNANVLQTIALHYVDNRSDKVYTIRLVERGEGYCVDMEYGRRGSTMQTGTKHEVPVSLEKAQKEYDKLVKRQLSKDYKEIVAGKAYEASERAGSDAGVRVQLLNAVDSDAQIEALLKDDSYYYQEKFDGERRVIIIDSDTVTGVNRKGLMVALAGEINDVIRTGISVTGRTLIDGEDFGTTFAPFDLLVLNGRDIRHLPYEAREVMLQELVANTPEFAHLVTYKTTQDKRSAREYLRTNGFEGGVFKLKSAPYTEGRPNSGGTQLKDKFVESATCRCMGVNDGKRSVGMELLDSAGNWVAVGNVTIPPNFSIPGKGNLLAVNYLYAYEGGSLFQPVFSGLRFDQDESDCTLAQLKYKSQVKHSQAA